MNSYNVRHGRFELHTICSGTFYVMDSTIIGYKGDTAYFVEEKMVKVKRKDSLKRVLEDQRKIDSMKRVLNNQ